MSLEELRDAKYSRMHEKEEKVTTMAILFHKEMNQLEKTITAICPEWKKLRICRILVFHGDAKQNPYAVIVPNNRYKSAKYCWRSGEYHECGCIRWILTPQGDLFQRCSDRNCTRANHQGSLCAYLSNDITECIFKNKMYLAQ